MTSLRKRRVAISRQLLNRLRERSIEDRIWDEFPPVGREWGSPDFERLMEEDRLNGAGVFDPALKAVVVDGLDVPEDLPIQERQPL